MTHKTAEHAYLVSAWWTSGRTGIAKSDSAPNAIHFTAPKEFGGLEGRWTPEELLLAALAGCFTITLRAIAGNAQFGKTELTALPCDMFTDRYAARATLWKVEVTASNV